MTSTFHFNISMVSRGKGKSAVESSAYNAREKITNEWDGITHDYHNKKTCYIRKYFYQKMHQKNFRKENLWNSIELFEKAINAQLAEILLLNYQKN